MTQIIDKRDLVKYYLKQAIMPVIALCLVGYFGWHAFQGKRGIHSLTQINAEIALTSTELEMLLQEEENLLIKVKALRVESLDRDLLEEKSRQMLNYSHPDDLIVYLD